MHTILAVDDPPSMRQMKQAGRDAGATGWRVKPFDPAMRIEVTGQVVRQFQREIP